MSVSLHLAMHAHQPVGNFGFVFEEAYQKAYEPFLTVLERHPGVRVNLHYSGPLLDWFKANRPDFLARLRALAASGQAELMASGYYEPILCLLPEADRQGQIAMMRERVQKWLGARPDGLWLTERVWEPDLAGTLSRAGIRYTVLDVNQFQQAKPYIANDLQVQDDQGWDLLGSYTTEFGGERVGIFPASRRLRYWIPFQDVSKTIEFLRRLQGRGPVEITYADDAEKFGLWPKTYDWVYQQGWLEQFFSALERESSWLRVTTFGDSAASIGPRGRVRLPTGSYDEMLEWSGGYFGNFLLKYPESNAMCQKMVTVSHRVQALRGASKKPSAALAKAQDHLYQAQCNDAYWHGVFGGLYLSHLRRAVYQHLVQAEQLLDGAEGVTTARRSLDVDGDGREELVVVTPRVQATIDPDEHGAMTELDVRTSACNLVDTLSRRYEPYHEKLKGHAQGHGGGQQPASIHDVARVKEQGLEAFLTYDDHRRTFFLDYGLSTRPSLEQLVRGTWGEHRLWSSAAWTLEPPSRDRLTVALTRPQHDGRLIKTIALAASTPSVSLRYELDGVRAPVIALEFNLALRDESRLTPAWDAAARELVVADPHARVRARLACDRPAAIATFPIETVSESDEGLERTPQGLAVVCLWDTGGASSWACGLEWTLETI